MHIGINALSIVPGATGGGETYLTGLARALAERAGGWRYTLFVSPRNREALSAIHPDIRCVVCRVSGPRVTRVAFERLRLPGLVAEAGVDVLFSPGNVAAPVRGCAQTVCIQSLLYRLAPKEVGAARRAYFEWALPRSVRRADMVIAVSEEARRQVLALGDVPEDKVRVVHEGVDPAFRPLTADEVERGIGTWGLAPGYVLFVSGLKRYKNADKLIRACALLKERGFARLVVIAGPDRAGLLPGLSALAVEVGLGEQVRFLGAVEHDKLPALYAGASVFVFPSAIETFGLPVLEAMACGTPVVGSNRSAVPEIVGDAGLIADPEDVAALADAIRRASEDEALRKTLREKGLERAGRFTWARAAEETVKVFEEAHRRWKGR
jgi:glycosyltransferase involved in cell wall biosynthesis